MIGMVGGYISVISEALDRYISSSGEFSVECGTSHFFFSLGIVISLGRKKETVTLTCPLKL